MKDRSVCIAAGCSCCENGAVVSETAPFSKYICDYFARPHREIDANDCCAFRHNSENNNYKYREKTHNSKFEAKKTICST